MLITWGGTLDKVVGRTSDLLCETLLRLPAGPYAAASHPLASTPAAASSRRPSC
jgi:hypothetical protein